MSLSCYAYACRIALLRDHRAVRRVKRGAFSTRLDIATVHVRLITRPRVERVLDMTSIRFGGYVRSPCASDRPGPQVLCR